MKDTHIVICEPQCRGYEHSLTNSAILETILLAYPEVGALFLGENEHIHLVRKNLRRFNADAETRVVWQEIGIPARSRGGWYRLHSEWPWCRQMLNIAKARSAEVLLLCSITDTGLLALKSLLYFMNSRMPVLAIPHSVLGSVDGKQSSRPWNRVLSMRQALRLPHPKMLQYIALGDPILRCLQQAQPRFAKHFSSLDLPYWMPQVEHEVVSEPLDRIRFGFLGVACQVKGFDMFTRLAFQVRARHPETEFVLAGYLRDTYEGDDYSEVIDGIGSQPLPREEYQTRATSLTYAIGVSDPTRYRLVANASFLDALAFTKPGIYLRNPYVEYYFNQLGDIGYLCEDEEELRKTVLEISGAFPAERYLQQCENIRRGRSVFEPRTLAATLLQIIDSVTG